jgi:tetrahydromethanopterin S-methyltransferase subunit G
MDTKEVYEALDKRLDKVETKISKVEEKIDKVVDTLGEINSTLAAQHVSLKEHIRRTGVAEDNIAMIRKDLEPIKTHVNRVSGALKLIGVVCAIVGAIAAVADALH